MRRTVTLIAMLCALALATSAAGWAQTNSPAGNQPSDSAPNTTAGAPSNQSGTGSNAGGDDVSGNRTQPGGAGATGGGAATETQRESDGGASKALIGFLVVLAILGAIAAVSISRRNRRADDRLESAGAR